MKHVFWIHSSITYYAALSVAEYLQMQDDDVIMLFSRNFKVVNSHYNVIDVSSWLSNVHPVTMKAIFSHKSYINDLDKEIEKIVHGDKFVAYVVSTAIIPNQVLITHKLCERYNFIEEGTINYIERSYVLPPVNRSFIIKLAAILFNFQSKRIQLNHPFLKPYHIRKDVVPFYYYICNDKHIKQDSHTVKLPLYKEIYNKSYDYSKSCMLIMSPYLELQMCTQDGLIQTLSFLAEKIQATTKKMFVKYHPTQYASVKLLLDNVFISYGIQLIKMDNSIPIEQILLNSSNISLFGFDSSVLLYANSMNKHKISSLSTYLLLNDNTYHSIHKNAVHTLFDDIQII